MAQVIGSAAVVWSAFSSLFFFFAVDPLISWADNRNDNRYVSIEHFGRYEIRAACQYAETQRDQINRIIEGFDNSTTSAIKSDYSRQLKKHTKRYNDWDCDDVLDMAPIPKRELQ